MRALRFEEFGEPDVLRLEEAPVPACEPDEVLVKVYAAGINPSDIKIVSGALGAVAPRTAGRDFAGVVVSDGQKKGMEVWGSGPGLGTTRDGSHAGYLVLPLDWVSEKPSRISMQQAAGVGIPYVTAWSAVVTAANVKAGETVLVTGGFGSVGRAAIQIAHWRKARVIGADRSSRASEADALIDTSIKDLAGEVMSLTNGNGVNAVIDTVGGPLFEPCLQSLAVDGRQAAITSVGNRRVEFDLIDFYHRRLQLTGVDSMKLTGPEIALILDQLRPGFDEGFLQPPDLKAWPLDQAVEAYRAVASGKSRVKHVLVMQ